jgi:hypothetical protein
MKDFKILIKYPTRERPDQFFKMLDLYIHRASSVNNIVFLITCDSDDITMNNSKVLERLENYKNTYNLYYYFGDSKTKVEAINNDMDKINLNLWDILIVAADDLEPIFNYDVVVQKDFKKYFPDTDGTIWYYDGFQDRTMTLFFMGKKYYLRFNYIAHPSYKSLWCDNEFTEVAKLLNKCQKSNDIVQLHKHPAWGKCEYDDLYIRNESYMDTDKDNFYKRKEINFNL